MPIEDPRGQKKTPPGFRPRHAPCSMDSKCASSRAKWRTVLQMTTSAHASSNDISSTASTEKFDSGSPGEGADALHGLHVRVNGVNFVPFPQEVNEVSTGTASGVQDSHSR